MKLDQLMTFHTVCSVRSFRRAAEMLHLTQPVVSKQIGALESELGERLLERGRNLVVTPAGNTLLKYAETLSVTLRNAQNEIADLKEMNRGHVVIGVSHTLATNLLPNLIEKFRKAYPNISVSIDTGWAPALVRATMFGFPR